MNLLDELRAVEMAVEALSERAKGASAQDMVDVGLSLWRISAIANEALEPIKAKIRSQALEKRNNQFGVAKIAGTRGDTKVNISEPLLRFTKDGQDTYRNLVDNSVFDSTVKTTTSYRIDKAALWDHLKSVDDPTKKRILGCFKHKSQTPRVSFQPKEDR